MAQIETNWTFIKSKINMPLYYIDYERQYYVFTISEPIIFFTFIEKSNPRNDNQIEFEDSYKNMISELSYYELAFPEVLISGNCDDSGAGWFAWDIKAEDKNRFLFGGQVLTNENILFGDSFTFQIIDKDNILGYGANTVLAEYIPKRYTTPNDKIDIKMNLGQIKLLYQGLYLRLKLHTVSTGFKVCCNYYFYEY